VQEKANKNMIDSVPAMRPPARRGRRPFGRRSVGGSRDTVFRSRAADQIDVTMNTTATLVGMAALVLAMSAPVRVEMTMAMGGRIDVIYTRYDEDNVDMGSGTELRRVRLYARGDIAGTGPRSPRSTSRATPLP
jgi:hypothetical protein